MLVGGAKTNGGTPTKKVSFVTNGADSSPENETGRESNERADRLERAKQDPNVRN